MFNIFVLVFFSVAVGLGLAIFMTRHKAPAAADMVIPEEDYNQDPTTERALRMDDLRKLAKTLFQENQLELSQTITENEFEEYWVGENKTPFYAGKYVFALVETGHHRSFITLADLLQFKDFVKGIEKNKGFYFTTGYFTRDVHQPLEGVPITLYNRKRVIEQMRQKQLL